MQTAVSTDRAQGAHPDAGTPSRRESLVAGVCAVLAAALYVAIAAWHGALGAARSDDWVYYRAAFRLARDSTFSADPWAFTMLVGHLLLAQPVIAIFGSSLTALQVMVAVLSAIALTATYLVLRSFVSREHAAFAVGCLALGPVYGSLSVSYMSDVPAFALEALVLLTGLRALRTDRFSVSWFMLSLLIGVAAFSIREYALAAPAAVSIVALRHVGAHDRTKLRRVAVSVSVGLLVVAGMYVGRHSLPGVSHVARPLQPPLVSAAYICSAAFTISLFAFPMLFLISVRAIARVLHNHRVKVFTVFVIVILLWACLYVADAVLVGNYLTPYGSYSETLPGKPPVVVPAALWLGLTIVSLVSLLCLLCLLCLAVGGRGLHKTPRDTGTAVNRSTAVSAGLQLSWAFCLVMFSGIAAVKIATPGVISDRYLIPIVPFVIAVAVHRAAENGLLVRSFRAVAVVSLSLMAVLGMTLVDAAATFDGAKWQIATSVQRSGFAPESIDGGYEWFGYHQPGELVDFALHSPTRNWWNRLFDKEAICVEVRHAVTAAEIGASKGEVVARQASHTALGVKYDLIALRTSQSCPVKPR